LPVCNRVHISARVGAVFSLDMSNQYCGINRGSTTRPCRLSAIAH
jgi:hypothetical protein